MLFPVLKYFGIIFWGLIIFLKSLNIKPMRKSIAIYTVFSFLLSASVVLLNQHIPEFMTLFIVFGSVLINKLVTKLKWNSLIIATIISCGISYALNTISYVTISVVITLITYPFFGNWLEIRSDVADWIMIILGIILTGFLSYKLFKIKRFKNGFPFLKENYISLLGVIIALVIFQFFTFSNIIFRNGNGELNSLALLSIVVVLFCIVIIIIWWRTGISKAYTSTLMKKENEELYSEIDQKDKQIAELTANNAALSKIIHKDNKRIPALENAVVTLCKDFSKEKAEEILTELERSTSERNSMINQYKSVSKKLPTTRISSLDMMLSFMMTKAYQNNIDFDVFVSGNIKEMINTKISEAELGTIAADLLENAIIAVKPSKNRQILFSIGILDGSYELRVEDSGVDFTEEVLQSFGKKQITTHKDEGGSGIGLVELGDIAKRNNAGIRIEKISKPEDIFTKRISVIFDDRCEVEIDYPFI